MLVLDHRPEEPSARRRFLQVREVAHAGVADAIRALRPKLDESGVQLLATYAIAGADGLFIAREIGGDAVDLLQLFDLHARVLADALGREQPSS
jgi:hypothetical protein